MDLAAVIMEQEYLNIRNSKTYAAWLYDKGRPIDPGAEDVRARFYPVDCLGPFKSKFAAVRAAEESISAGEPIHPDQLKRGRPRKTAS